MESKRDKFVRLAEKRTNTALETLRILGHCANRNSYEYSENDVIQIFDVIETQVKTTKALFSAGAKKEFKLEGSEGGDDEIII